ncbi:MAG: Fur family transcriptional regulator [Chloroflexota bacterium]
MELSGKRLGERLRQGGYRLTAPRRAVLEVISGTRESLTPALIYQKVRRSHPGIGLVTVYRTLEVLAGMGLLCEVRGGDSHHGYLVRRPEGHHHHLVCSDCGTVVDFTRCDLAKIEDKLERETGFKIKEHLLEFQGRCRRCQQARGEKDDA